MQVFHLKPLLKPELAATMADELREATWLDGRSSATGVTKRQKSNEHLPLDHPLAIKHGKAIHAALGRNEGFRLAVMPHTVPPMRFSRYREGMAYGHHLDLPVMNFSGKPLRTDMSLTVWLTPPDSYEGGELVIGGPAGPRAYKGNIGDAVVYPSATIHEVRPVTSGERMVAITWIQSLIRDPTRREILMQVADLAERLPGDANDPHVRRAHEVHHKLVRMWADC